MVIIYVTLNFFVCTGTQLRAFKQRINNLSFYKLSSCRSLYTHSELLYLKYSSIFSFLWNETIYGAKIWQVNTSLKSLQYVVLESLANSSTCNPG